MGSQNAPNEISSFLHKAILSNCAYQFEMGGLAQFNKRAVYFVSAELDAPHAQFTFVAYECGVSQRKMRGFNGLS